MGARRPAGLIKRGRSSSGNGSVRAYPPEGSSVNAVSTGRHAVVWVLSVNIRLIFSADEYGDSVEDVYGIGGNDFRAVAVQRYIVAKIDRAIAASRIKFQDRVRANRPVADVEHSIHPERTDLHNVAPDIERVFAAGGEIDRAITSHLANVDGAPSGFDLIVDVHRAARAGREDRDLSARSRSCVIEQGQKLPGTPHADRRTGRLAAR